MKKTEEWDNKIKKALNPDGFRMAWIPKHYEAIFISVSELLAHALAEREREIRKQFTILGGSIRTVCCDERIREDKDSQLWCMGCGKHMGGLVPKENL